MRGTRGDASLVQGRILNLNLVCGPNGDASLVVCGPNGDASLSCLALIDWSTGVCAAQLFGSFEVLFPAQGIRGPPTTPGLAPPAWG